MCGCRSSHPTGLRRSRRPCGRTRSGSVRGDHCTKTGSSTARCSPVSGRSALGRRLMVDPLSLTIDACLEAVTDAGLELADIDGLSTYPGVAGMRNERGRGDCASRRPCGSTPRGSTGAASCRARAERWWPPCWPWRRGSADTSCASAPSGSRPSPPCAWAAPPGPALGSVMAWRAPFGALSAANWIAMNAQQYLHRYGAPREMLGLIALNGRANAARNPAAIYRDPMTMDEYLSARPITYPLRPLRLRCARVTARSPSWCPTRPPAADRPRPGRSDRGGGHPDPRACLLGPGHDHPRAAGARARPPISGHGRSLLPDDVDLALLYDGFTFNAISWIEALGFCDFGEAYDWLDGGRRIALDGQLPVNPHGGQLSEGPDPRLRLPLRGHPTAAPRRRSPAGARGGNRGGHLGWRRAVRRTAVAATRPAEEADRRIPPPIGTKDPLFFRK